MACRIEDRPKWNASGQVVLKARSVGIHKTLTGWRGLEGCKRVAAVKKEHAARQMDDELFLPLFVAES